MKGLDVDRIRKTRVRLKEFLIKVKGSEFVEQTCIKRFERFGRFKGQGINKKRIYFSRDQNSLSRHVQTD